MHVSGLLAATRCAFKKPVKYQPVVDFSYTSINNTNILNKSLQS